MPRGYTQPKEKKPVYCLSFCLIASEGTSHGVLIPLPLSVTQFSGQEKTSGRESQMLLELGCWQHIVERFMYMGCGQGPHQQWLSLCSNIHSLNLLPLRLFPPILEYSPTTYTHTDRLKQGRDGCLYLVYWSLESASKRERAAKKMCVHVYAWRLDVCISVSFYTSLLLGSSKLFQKQYEAEEKIWMFMSSGPDVKSDVKVSWRFPLYQHKPGPSIGIPLERSKYEKKQLAKKQGCR